MVPILKFGAAALIAALLAPLTGARAQQAVPPAENPLQITWEVRNRFRLFKEERDFQLHVEAQRGQTILAAEQALAVQSDGRGWARNTVGRLCIDMGGKISEPCTREGAKESYLTPGEHPVTVRLAGPIPVGATCAWSFDEGEGPPRQSTVDCGEPINFRARYGRPTVATVEVAGPETAQRLSAEIQVRDVLIAGLGDSIASGEGNPDRPVGISDDGFCFRSFIGSSIPPYYRPGRAGYKGDRTCDAGTDGANGLAAWQRRSAEWFNAACHRSLYSYQTRTALALAVRNPHIAVTYLPLACTGATIADGLLGSQRARECYQGRGNTNCPTSVPAQIAELRDALAAAKRRQPDRQLDLVLLSVGANDVDFSGLVAEVIVNNTAERAMFKGAGVLGSVEASRAALRRDLPRGFSRLREALRPLVGDDLSRVVYAAYGNPALANGAPCAGGPAGFDIHPAFNADPARLERVASFVDDEFLPYLKSLALCQGGVLCRDARRDRFTFVDGHQTAFATHGFCVRSQSDPAFDRQCFSSDGKSFNTDLATAPTSPMACGLSASSYRAYLPRGRWIRDANDSYFSAMTYPLGVAIQPADIHDATWGVLSAVYGGAIHPTAEGHAAMADATLPAAATILGLGAAVRPITGEPIMPLSPAAQ